MSHTFSSSWVQSTCENCLKNSHEEERMVLKKIVSPNDESLAMELFVCGKCGFTRRL